MRDEEKTGVKEYFLYGSDIGSNKCYFSKQILLLLFNGGELSESLFPSILELNKKETNRAVKKIVQATVDLIEEIVLQPDRDPEALIFPCQIVERGTLRKK